MTAYDASTPTEAQDRLAAPAKGEPVEAREPGDGPVTTSAAAQGTPVSSATPPSEPVETLNKQFAVAFDALEAIASTDGRGASIAVDALAEIPSIAFDNRSPPRRPSEPVEALDPMARVALTASLSQKEGAIPEGWRLVPVQATSDMIGAGRKRVTKSGKNEIDYQARVADHVYDAMLAAAPPPPVMKEES